MRNLTGVGIGAGVSLIFAVVFYFAGASFGQAVAIFLVSFLISVVVQLLFARGGAPEDPIATEIAEAKE